MRSVTLPGHNPQRADETSPSPKPLQLPRFVRPASILALRQRLPEPPSKTKDRPKKKPTPSPSKARAGPRKEMNVIDLTSDSEDDHDHDPEPDLSPEEDMYDDDPSDEEGPPMHLAQRHQANQIAPNVNGPNAPQAAPQQPPAFQPPAPEPGNLFGGGGGDVWGDYILDDAFDDENIARAFAQDVPQVAQPQNDQPVIDLEREALARQPAPDIETKDDCVANVMALFPDICSEHVSELFDKVAHSSDRLIAHILDKMEKGASYPKAKDKHKTLKRKREIDDDEAAELKYGAPDRAGQTDAMIQLYIKSILQQEFAETPVHFIMATLQQSQFRLYRAYRVLEAAHRTYDPANPPYNKIKTARKMLPDFQDAGVQATIANKHSDQSRVEILRELCAARRIRQKAEEQRELERQAELEEEANEKRAMADGTMSECGCCFGDYPMNRMVHCDADVLHWFCRGCAKQTADTEIGSSRYELHCMSMDGCTGGFSKDQRSIFLDAKTTIALERNEQEAVLRMAGIENLASCPFCPYAAEYPPVEINKEFRCEAPDCEKVSCRLCKLESHIPKSCDEFAKENGLSIRRQIEEAMSAALIRKCNKCGTPFVKEEGCNKMTCTRNGCYNVQCYVCSKSCSYDHFDDSSRGGKKGNCPLFESVIERHDIEVKKAEELALQKVRAEHPEYTEEDLRVKMSENVKKDDELKKARDPRVGAAGMALQQQQMIARANAAIQEREQARIRAAAIRRDGAGNNLVQDLFPQAAQQPGFQPRAMVDRNPVGHNLVVPANNWLDDDAMFLGLWEDMRGVGNRYVPQQPPAQPPAQPPQPPQPRLQPQRQPQAFDFQHIWDGDPLQFFNEPYRPRMPQAAHHVQAVPNNNAQPAVAAQLPARPRVARPPPGLGRVRTPSKNKAPEAPAELKHPGGAQVNNLLERCMSRMLPNREERQRRRSQLQNLQEKKHAIPHNPQSVEGRARSEALVQDWLLAAPQQHLQQRFEAPNALARADHNIHMNVPQMHQYPVLENAQQQQAARATRDKVELSRARLDQLRVGLTIFDTGNVYKLSQLAQELRENKRLLERILQPQQAINEANIQPPNLNRELLHQQRFMNLDPLFNPLVPRRNLADRVAQDPFFEGKVVPRGPRAMSQELAEEDTPYWNDYV